MEGIGESVDASSLEVVIDKKAGVTAGFSFVENDTGTIGVEELIGDGDFEAEFFRAEDVVARRPGLPVGKVIEGDQQGSVRFMGCSEAVGAVLNEGIDDGVGGEGLNAREDDPTFGEGNVDGFDGFEVGRLVAAELIAGTGSEAAEKAKGESEEEEAHRSLLGSEFIDPALGLGAKGAGLGFADGFAIVEKGRLGLALFAVEFSYVEGPLDVS